MKYILTLVFVGALCSGLNAQPSSAWHSSRHSNPAILSALWSVEMRGNSTLTKYAAAMMPAITGCPILPPTAIPEGIVAIMSIHSAYTP